MSDTHAELRLEKLPALISVIAASILGLSVVYDYGFFYILGTGFSEMPTTLSDHLRSSLSWIPETIIVIFAVVAFEMFNRRIEQGKTEEEIIQSSPMPKFMAWFRASPKYPIIALALSLPLSLWLNPDLSIQLQHSLFSLIIIWYIFHSFLFGHERIVQRTSKEFLLASRWLPIILIFFAFNGAIAASNIKAGRGTNYVLKLDETEIIGTLARTFDKYYLIWDKDKESILLVNTSKVSQLYPAPKTEESTKRDNRQLKAANNCSFR